jgi:cell division protein FtsI (penicillin-binding protein 3)
VTRASYVEDQPAAAPDAETAALERLSLAALTPVEEAPAESEPGVPPIMPDLRGQSAREAAIKAARRGLIVELRGSGHVVAQSPEAGTEIEPGLTCVLTLGHESESRP